MLHIVERCVLISIVCHFASYASRNREERKAEPALLTGVFIAPAMRCDRMTRSSRYEKGVRNMISYEPYECLNGEITGDYDEAHAVKCVNGD